MNDIIIHISDLHISDQSGKLGNAFKTTYLTLDDEKNYNYIKEFTSALEKIKCNNKYLIITGDITNIAEKNEFEKAVNILKIIIDDLSLSKENILLIPGDHDVHRDSIKELLRDNPDSTSIEVNKIKFNNFNLLYKEIKGVDFDANKIIFDKLVIDELVFLGVNSNMKIDHHGGVGYLDTKSIENELKSIREEGKEYVLCLHHNLEGEFEDKGQWDEVNKKNLKRIFEGNNIKLILNGNEHTPNSKLLAGSVINLSDSGVFASKNEPTASFKYYEIVKNENELLLKNNIKQIRIINGKSESNFGSWITINLDEIKTEIKEFIFKTKTNLPVLPIQEELPELEVDDELPELGVNDEDNNPVDEIKIYENKDFQQKIYSIIKDKSLFQQGHFHWSESSRAHNWINVSRMLEDNKDLQMINDTIIDLIEQFDLDRDTNLMIGLGYEGNMIASKASMKYNFPYTYFPYSYRSKDHLDFENKLDFDNSEGQYKNVIIVTDVVNGANTIKKFILERETTFFKNVEKIILISLFYTGDKVLNYKILNGETFKNIEFYSVKHLKVEKCPYKDYNYRDECIILKDKLNCVHKFYNEKLVSK